jgi:hypothetical protein
MSRTALGRNLYKLFPSMDLLLFAELKSRNIRRLAVAYVTAGLLLNSLSRFSDPASQLPMGFRSYKNIGETDKENQPGPRIILPANRDEVA